MDTKNNPDLLTIGVVAKSFGVNENTIRRMEAAGLLSPALIKDSGYRYYDRDNISRIKLILTLRSLGLIYDDMREFINDPSDFTPVYNKLFEKKLALDSLLNSSRMYLRPDEPGEISITHHTDICLFTKAYEITEGLELKTLDELASHTLSQAINGKYPIDYTKPITILSDYLDFKQFSSKDIKRLILCVPLREAMHTPDTYVIPSRRVISFAWRKGFQLSLCFENLTQYMKSNHLRQNGELGATFEIGKHLDSNIKEDEYLFHVMIPCEKI
jgi:DNA-binding transcriptional MerR regulator